MDSMNWRKSKYSANGEACVEVASAAVPRPILVRDTVDRDGTQLAFTHQAWREFAVRVKTSRTQ
jgi:hypothetical protein